MNSEIKVSSSIRNYKILFCNNIILQINRIVDHNKKIFLVTDENVYKLYENFIDTLNSEYLLEVLVVPSGGKSKNLRNVEKAYCKLIDKNFKKSDVTIAFGGGVIGDLGGYIAATYSRGMRFIQIPTTLLSQIDSSIGGKVAIHYNEITNIIGTIYPPEVTLVSTKFLNTLPKRELQCGFSEIIKMFFIHNSSLLKILNDNSESLLNLSDEKMLESTIFESILLKKSIVQKDEFESDVRLSLNYGHTLGHCIETICNHSSILHGEAIAIGMMFEAYFGYHNCDLDLEKIELLRKTLKTYNLPTVIKEINDDSIQQLDIDNILKVMKTDKKNYNNKIALIIPSKDYYKIQYFESESVILHEELKSFIALGE